MSEPAATAPPPAVAERASLADWLAVAAGMLGALMALIDISIVNASLPTIQGEIGATPSEGTWIGTSYLVAEIVVIPLTAWLERLMGLRRLLLGSATGLTAAGDQFWSQDSAGVLDVAEGGDQFGDALAVGDFNDDGFPDLAIGDFGEDIGAAIFDGGAVNVLPGSAAGLTAAGDQFWSQDSATVLDIAEIGDNFGSF